MELHYNFDCNTLYRTYYPQLEPGEPFHIGIIRDYLDLVLDSGVTTLVMNGNAQPPWYPSATVPWVYAGYTRGDRDFFRPTYPPLSDDFTQEQLDRILVWSMQMADFFLDVKEAGIDWFRFVAEHVRERGARAVASVRMNDAHGGNSWDHCYMNSPPQRDPGCRLPGQPLDPRAPTRNGYRLLNYALPRVRDYMLSVVRDAIENYPYQGIELDWLRCPFCCQAPATVENQAAMLAFFREIRTMADARATANGAPYPVSLRIPGRLGLLAAIGIDVPRLADEGLIDAIATSNFFQSTWDTDYAALRSQLPAGIVIQGVIEATPNWIDCLNPASDKRGYRLQSASAPHLRANAAGKLATGVDSLYLFNFFAADEPDQRNPDPSRRQAAYGVLNELTSLEELRGKPKHYVLANQYGPWDFPPFESADQLPAAPGPGRYQPFRLAACAEPAGTPATVEVVMERSDAAPHLGVSLNGSWPTFDAEGSDRLLTPCGEFTHHLPEQRALRFSLPGAALRDGLNEIAVYNESPAAVQIVSLELLTGQAPA